MSKLDIIFETLVFGPDFINKQRTDFIEWLRRRRGELEELQLQVYTDMHPDVRRVMQGKATLLMGELASMIGMKDEKFLEDLHKGFSIIGSVSHSGEYPPEHVPALMPTSGLETVAKWSQHAVRGHLARPDRFSAEVLAQTLAEAGEDDGSLIGPMTKEEVDSRFGSLWVPVPRFGIDQHGSTRAIDDASMFLQNATVERSWKLILDGLDRLVAIARTWISAVVGREVAITYPDGTVRRGLLHHSWLGMSGSTFKVGFMT